MTINGNELIADSGYKLTDGTGYYSRVRLGVNDSADRYTEVAEADIPVEDETEVTGAGNVTEIGATT